MGILRDPVWSVCPVCVDSVVPENLTRLRIIIGVFSPLSFSVSIGQALERGGMQASCTGLKPATINQ